MSTRRMILGALPGGGFGLRISLPGYDVIDDNPNDPGKFSFDSSWTDLVKISNIGIATIANSTTPGNNEVLITNLGYKPYFEIRIVSGNTVYDDYNFNTPNRPGYFHQAEAGKLLIGAVGTFVYVTFQIPAAVQ